MRRIALILLFLQLLVVTPWRVPLTSAITLDQIRLSWQHDPQTTMTVMWRTQSNPSTALGEYPKVQYGSTASYGQEATGTSQAAVLDGYFYHTVELTGLTPATMYHYRVSGAAGTWSADSTFRTAPSGPTDFTFTAFADNGIPANARPFSETAKDLVLAQNPAFHLIAGDLTYADGDSCNGSPCIKEHWEQWFTDIARFTKTVPTMPALGNHERAGDVKFSSGELFYTRSFALPSQNGEQYYSFDYGDIHFVALNSDDDSSLQVGRAQYEWLRADLVATMKKFKVVVLHHMVYASTSGHSVRERIQNNLSPLFDQYDVDLVIQGHNHNYERTLPIRFGSYQNPVIATVERVNYVNPDGTIYVTTGGAGQGLASFSGTQAVWSAVQCKCHEIMRVDVDDAGILSVRVIGENNATVDQFTISKTGAITPPTTNPTPSAPQSTPVSSNIPPAPLTTTAAPEVPNVQTIRGFNFAVWSSDALSQDSARRSIDALKATGANYFGLAPFWYQDNKTSTTIYRRDSKTATDASIRSAIRYAKSLGLKVALKPMLDSRDGTWRGQLEPTNVEAWFQSYRAFILTYARIAQEEDVDYLIVGTEFATLTTPIHTARWRELIREVREIYRGPLTYAANWGKPHEGEYYHIEFWDALDSIGIDAYFPVASDANPTVSSVESAWTFINSGGSQNWFADISALHERFHKPVLFTELGYLSCDGAGIRPWEYPCNRTIDLDEQATLYEGTLRFWKNVDWMLGYLWWRWDVDPNKGGLTDGDYVPQNKPPTLEVLRRFWTASVSAITAPSTSTSANSSPPTSSSTLPPPPATNSPPEANSNSSSRGGGGGLVITTPSTTSAPPSSPSLSMPPSSLTTSPSTLAPRLFAYGKPRLRWPGQERERAWQLALALRGYFKGPIPLAKRYWPVYINAYIYGDYPAFVIARAIRLGGYVVHPSIPWSAWRRSPQYQTRMP